MDGIKIDVIGNVARVIERPARITAGTVGLPIEFTFDEQWDGLDKTAVFKGSGTTKIVERLGSETIVPWEVLEKPNTYLHVGVYGTNNDGTLVIPTTWANVHGICKGVSPDGDVSTDPTLPVWQTLLNDVGDLSELETENKDDLVKAINEARSMAAAGGIESDPTLSKKGKAADAKATGDAIRSLTAEDVGARPDTWTPTAADVGARPNTWTPTAADVGARPDTWIPTAEEVGATPNSHSSDASNPHGVTKTQVGLGNVDNTSDIDKPISTAQAEAIADAKKAGTDAQIAADNAQTAAENAERNAKIYADNLHIPITMEVPASGWSESAPYTQTIVVDSILSDDTPHYGVVYSADIDTALAQKEAFALVDDLDTADGSVTFTCFEEKPEADLTIQLEVNR